MKIVKIIIIVSLFFHAAGCKRDAAMITLNKNLCSAPGRTIADGEIPLPEDLALDAFCAAEIMKQSAPNGAVTIFGSARSAPDWQAYKDALKFAYLWTKEMGDKYPVLTGGGPGIMEAGNRGAKEAGGKSLYFSVNFGGGAEKPNSYTTEGYMHASFSQREASLVDYAAAVVIAQGGVGTEWEIFETLSKIQTKKKKNCPVVLLGGYAQWQSLFNRMHAMAAMKTISPDNINLLMVAETPEQAVAIIKKSLAK